MGNGQSIEVRSNYKPGLAFLKLYLVSYQHFLNHYFICLVYQVQFSLQYLRALKILASSI